MSAIVHLVLRLTGRASDFDQTLNVIGMGMLTPMLAVWLWDWAMIALNLYQFTIIAVSHTAFQLWEVAVEAVGFKRTLGLGTALAIGLSLVINVVFILVAMLFAR